MLPELNSHRQFGTGGGEGGGLPVGVFGGAVDMVDGAASSRSEVGSNVCVIDGNELKQPGLTVVWLAV